MRRVLVLLLTFSMLIGLVTGCSKGGGGNGDKKAEGPKKDTLVVMGFQKADTFDPLNTALNYKLEWHQLFDVLVEFDEKGEMVPALAESFELTEDGKGYIFHLRDDVKFTDGTQFNADAVKFAVDMVRTSELAKWMAAYIGEATVIDEYTVQINKAASHIKLLEFLSEFLYIVSPTAYQKDPEGFATNPVGSGPYKFKEIAADGYTYMVANEDYYKGAPYFKNLTIRTPLDPSTATVALQNGEIDVALMLPQDQIAVIKDNPKLNVIGSSGWSTKTVFLEGPNLMNDLNLRKAIYHAINRENAIIFDNAPEGTKVAENMFSERMMGEHAGFMDIGGYDVELAKEYLAKSDYDGRSLKITITSDMANMAQAIQEDLKAIGITTAINQLDSNAFWAAFADGSCDITITSWGCDYASLEEQMGFHAGRGYYGKIVYNTPEFDALLDQCGQVWDEAERGKLTQEALKMTYDFANMIPIYEDPLYNVYNAELKGVEDIWSATINLYLYKLKM